MPTPSPASPLEAHLGYWLRFVSNHVSYAFTAKLKARDVTPAEWVVLRQLYDEAAMRPSALADRIGLTRGAVSKLADRLEAKGLARRTSDAEDGRAHTLALTPRGRALVPKLAALADRNDAEFFGHLAPAERLALERLLKEIVRRHDLKALPLE
ncbi:MAG: MarR family transcriptional regulator [Reyranellaceae bacterium]